MARESWHLDKKVPIALIIALTVQMVGFVWWFSTTTAYSNARNDRQDDDIRDLKVSASSMSDMKADVAVIKSGMVDIKATLSKIK